MSQPSNILSNISSSLNNTSNNIQYSIKNTIYSSVYGIPIITITLIGITSVILAYVTIVETDDTVETLMDVSPPIQTGGNTKKNRKKHRNTKKRL